MSRQTSSGVIFSLLLAIAAMHISTCNCCSDETCPTWFYRYDKGRCRCGSSLGTVVVCNNETQEVSVLGSFCMTSISLHENCTNTTVVGRCLFSLHHGKETADSNGLYIEVHPSPSTQDHKLCGYLNRQGRLCGSCKQNYYASAYSYDLKCYQCHSSWWSNCITYLAVAYVPLTAFLALVMAFCISVTSPHMNAPVLMWQVFTLPANIRYIIQVTRNTLCIIFVKLIATVYGIWNLDFFRTLVPPICLPLNTMQMIALDYLVAVYPLFLLACFYVLLTAHDRGCRLVVRLWRPLLWCTARLRQHWNVRRSIIDAFAMFLLLSYIKILNTSFDLLVPTNIFDVHGQWVGYFLYYDVTIEYMGPQHKLYASLAIIILLVGILFPLVLLLLYPMQWFQKCLNKCHLNSPGLQIFMQCFQGYYRDRTDGGRECRYFAALYPAFRMLGFSIYAITRSSIFFPHNHTSTDCSHSHCSRSTSIQDTTCTPQQVRHITDAGNDDLLYRLCCSVSSFRQEAVRSYVWLWCISHILSHATSIFRCSAVGVCKTSCHQKMVCSPNPAQHKYARKRRQTRL